MSLWKKKYQPRRSNLGEVADKVATVIVIDREDVEEEWFDVVVQSLVIEEELRQETQVLAVDFVTLTVDLEHGQVTPAVDLVTGGMVKITLRLQQDTENAFNTSEMWRLINN